MEADQCAVFLLAAVQHCWSSVLASAVMQEDTYVILKGAHVQGDDHLYTVQGRSVRECATLCSQDPACGGVQVVRTPDTPKAYTCELVSITGLEDLQAVFLPDSTFLLSGKSCVDNVNVHTSSRSLL